MDPTVSHRRLSSAFVTASTNLSSTEIRRLQKIKAASLRQESSQARARRGALRRAQSSAQCTVLSSNSSCGPDVRAHPLCLAEPRSALFMLGVFSLSLLSFLSVFLLLLSMRALALPSVALPFSYFSSRRRAATSGLANYTKVPTFSLSLSRPMAATPRRSPRSTIMILPSGDAGDAHYLACSGRPATAAASVNDSFLN